MPESTYGPCKPGVIRYLESLKDLGVLPSPPQEKPATPAPKEVDELSKQMSAVIEAHLVRNVPAGEARDFIRDRKAQIVEAVREFWSVINMSDIASTGPLECFESALNFIEEGIKEPASNSGLDQIEAPSSLEGFRVSRGDNDLLRALERVVGPELEKDCSPALSLVVKHHSGRIATLLRNSLIDGFR
jgi:hypothetical protein